MKRFGITKGDPDNMSNIWRDKINLEFIKTGLTYEEALEIEDDYKKLGCDCGPRPGGPRRDGPVYSVYIYDHKKL